jgi:GABA permease
VNASGALILASYIAISLAYIRLRRRQIAEGTEFKGQMRPFPAVAYVTIAAIAAVMLAMATTPELAAHFYASLVPLVVVTLIYLARTRLRR